ncbi:MAG: hypothetical protein FWD93_00175 [Coriobacteriia bacterium]|nr:hypothetical protein [Coriobacteriia bacterium]
MATNKETLSSADKSGNRKQRIGIYLSCKTDRDEDYERSLAIMQALGQHTDTYDIYLYSPYKIWKQYCWRRPLFYRPFPTSGASNALGRIMFRKYLEAPDPPEWLGEMLARKARDEKLIVLIFPTPNNMEDVVTIPVVHQSDLPADLDASPMSLSKQLLTVIKTAINNHKND